MTKYAKCYSLDDGYGIVGAGWKCVHCKEKHDFVFFIKDEELYCDKCHMISVAPEDSDHYE